MSTAADLPRDGRRTPPPSEGGGGAVPSPSRSRRWQRLVLAAVRAAAGRVQSLPRAKAMRLGVRLGRLGYAVAGRQRRIADRNLRLAYGDALSSAERDALIRRVFESFGKFAVDFVRSPLVRTPGDLAALVPEVSGWDEHVSPVVAAGRPVVFVVGHLGNWEVLGRWIAAQGVRLTVVAREPEDPEFGAWVRSVREGAGFAVASKGESARPLLSVLKRGEALALLPDQNSGDLFVPFFGVPAGTVAGPALLARRTGAALIPIYCLRRPDDAHRVIVLPPIPADPSADQDADVARMMGEVNRVLEGVIRGCPEQWLWLHNRWKSAFEEKNLPRWPETVPPEQREEALRRWSGAARRPPAATSAPRV